VPAELEQEIKCLGREIRSTIGIHGSILPSDPIRSR